MSNGQRPRGESSHDYIDLILPRDPLQPPGGLAETNLRLSKEELGIGSSAHIFDWDTRVAEQFYNETSHSIEAAEIRSSVVDNRPIYLSSKVLNPARNVPDKRVSLQLASSAPVGTFAFRTNLCTRHRF